MRLAKTPCVIGVSSFLRGTETVQREEAKMVRNRRVSRERERERGLN